MNKDTFGRKIDYLRISVTDKCNYRCSYCMPKEGVTFIPHSQILTLEQIAMVAKSAGILGFKKIKLTGGEPLVRKNIEHLIYLIKETGLYSDIGITTNGSLLTPELALKLRSAGLMRMNISLDTLDADHFRKITHNGNIHDVFNGIESAILAGFEKIKINMVVFAGTESKEIDAMRSFCNEKGLLLQLIKRFSLKEKPALNGGIVKFDRPYDCSDCNRLRLTADGHLKSCLYSDSEIKVDLNNIEDSILRAINVKPEYSASCTGRYMHQIGG
jgi:cyclic pyranopterin phosphate synthase